MRTLRDDGIAMLVAARRWMNAACHDAGRTLNRTAGCISRIPCRFQYGNRHRRLARRGTIVADTPRAARSAASAGCASKPSTSQDALSAACAGLRLVTTETVSFIANCHIARRGVPILEAIDTSRQHLPIPDVLLQLRTGVAAGAGLTER